MAAVIHRLRTRSNRLRKDEAADVRQRLLPLLDDPALGSHVVRVLRRMIGVLDAETASENKWSFVMLSPAQNDAVVNMIAARSRRPVLTLRLWALCFRYLRSDTGEIILSRDEIALALGVEPRDVTRCMSELVEFEAISRIREAVPGLRGPGVVRYFMNPNVATHLSGKDRDAAQHAAPILKLIGSAGHPAQRRARRSRRPVPVLDAS